MAVTDTSIGVKERRTQRQRKQRNRKLLLVVGVTATTVGLIVGAIALRNIFAGSPAVQVATTVPRDKTSGLGGYAVAPDTKNTPAAENSTARSATTTFTVKLPQSARSVAHAGDTRDEQLTFALGKAHAIVVSQPSMGGLSLYRYLVMIGNPGETISPLKIGGRSGYLQRETSRGKTALAASFLHGEQVFTVEMYGPSSSQATMLRQLKMLADSIKPNSR